MWAKSCMQILPWWRHQMEKNSALLAICAGNSPVPGEFPAQTPVTRSFDVFFDLHPNKRLSKQWWDRWYEMLSCPLWRHRNELHWCHSRRYNVVSECTPSAVVEIGSRGAYTTHQWIKLRTGWNTGVGVQLRPTSTGHWPKTTLIWYQRERMKPKVGTWSISMQEIAYLHWNAKPRPEPVLIYCHLDPFQ